MPGFGLRARATDLGYGAGWRAVRLMPERMAAGAFRAGADIAARRESSAAGRGEAGQLRRNLARVLGRPAAQVPDELVRDALRSYARYWREAFRLPSMDHVRLAADPRLRLTGLEHLDAALARGRGVILALPHSGNWDIAGMWLVQQHGQFSTVAERLRPESLFERFVAYRESLGFEVFPLTGGEQPPFQLLAERLRANRIVCLLSERDLQRHGVAVTFFDGRTRFAAGPARLAVETGAALLPVGSWFTDIAGEGEGWGFRVGAPIDTTGGVPAATQLLADEFATDIAAHPADWHMLQPLWLGDLTDARLERIGEG